jgi:hypothetical protein
MDKNSSSFLSNLFVNKVFQGFFIILTIQLLSRFAEKGATRKHFFLIVSGIFSPYPLTHELIQKS